MNTTSFHALVVDDHRVFAEGLVSVLQITWPQGTFTLAASGEEAWAKIETVGGFDLVITDISMGGMSGLELATRVKKTYPAIKVLILSMHNERPIIKSAMDTEAEGFILKTATAAEISQAIGDLLDHRTHYSREVLNILLVEARKEKKQELVKVILTEREREILTLILDEYSSEAIAAKLFISKRTVDTHRSNIMEKTGCQNLIALYKFAIKYHLVDVDLGTST